MNEQIQNLSWSSIQDQWGSSNYRWIDTYIVIRVAGIIGGGGGGGFSIPTNSSQNSRVGKVLYSDTKTVDVIRKQLSVNEFDLFIKLVCKVNGISIEEIKKRESNNKPIIKIKEIETTIEEVTKPQVTVKMISRCDI
jgi:hypothetical protein